MSLSPRFVHCMSCALDPVFPPLGIALGLLAAGSVMAVGCRDAPTCGHPRVSALSSYLDQRGVLHPLENDTVSCAGSWRALSHRLLCLFVSTGIAELLRL